MKVHFIEFPLYSVLNFSSEDESSMILRNVDKPIRSQVVITQTTLGNKVLSSYFWFISPVMLTALKKAHEILVHPVSV
jgi:hypothetical protein